MANTAYKQTSIFRKVKTAVRRRIEKNFTGYKWERSADGSSEAFTYFGKDKVSIQDGRTGQFVSVRIEFLNAASGIAMPYFVEFPEQIAPILEKHFGGFEKINKARK